MCWDLVVGRLGFMREMREQKGGGNRIRTKKNGGGGQNNQRRGKQNQKWGGGSEEPQRGEERNNTSHIFNSFIKSTNTISKVPYLQTKTRGTLVLQRNIQKDHDTYTQEISRMTTRTLKGNIQYNQDSYLRNIQNDNQDTSN